MHFRSRRFLALYLTQRKILTFFRSAWRWCCNPQNEFWPYTLTFMQNITMFQDFFAEETESRKDASQYRGRAVRYANTIARYVSAWFAGLRFLSVPSGTEGISARYASRTWRHALVVVFRLSRHFVPGYPLPYLTARFDSAKMHAALLWLNDMPLKSFMVTYSQGRRLPVRVYNSLCLS